MLLMALIVVVGVISTAIVARRSSHSEEERAFRLAENISLQLMNLSVSKFQQKTEKNYRGLASLQGPDGEASRAGSDGTKSLGSEGTIGRDPWGNPFRYKFVENGEGEWSYLIIWSSGPDSKMEIQMEDWTFEKAKSQLGHLLKGPRDDFALVKALYGAKSL